MAKILVVDDEKNIRITLSEILKDEGHEIATAEDAFTALEILKQRQDIELIICDIMLPRIKGTDLLFTIRAVYPSIKLILITGQPSNETKQIGESAGAMAYLSKPVTKDTISSVIKEVLS